MLQPKFDMQHIFNKLFDDADYLYTTSFSSYKDNFEALNFHCLKNKNITEFFSYVFKSDYDILGYVTFENHSDVFISEEDKVYLHKICNILNRRFADFEFRKKMGKELDIYKSMSETSGLEHSVVVIKKDNNKVLYSNNRSPLKEKNIHMLEKYYKDLTEKNTSISLEDEINKSKYVTFDAESYILRMNEISWEAYYDAYIFSIVNISSFAKDTIYYDALTSAPTLLGLTEKLSTKDVKDESFAIISIDINKFKFINHTHSYSAGDNVLKDLVLVINNFILEDEYYCRVVADKFAIIVKFKDDDSLKKRISLLDSMCSNMQKEKYPNIAIVITGGVYIVESDLYSNMQFALDSADMARTSSKDYYKNSFTHFSNELTADLKHNKFVEDKVLDALKNDEFFPYLQAKFNLKTNVVIGAEALVRWESSERTIYPDEFIPIFEKNGFITTLDFIVYKKVFEFIRNCLDANIKVVPISINASRNHIETLDFIPKLLELFDKYDVPRELIEVEITENAFGDDNDDRLFKFIQDLREQEIKISIDDFGAAYSSLNTLKDLNVDILKLDKAFIDKVSSENSTDLLSKDKVIIKNIINMANELNYSVICEGVETHDQIEFLKSIDCENGQGYIFSKPIPLDDFKENFLL